VKAAAAAARIGVLGGTFDPVHRGHVASAEHVARAQALDCVLLVLSARPPHKSEVAHASVEHRFAMLELATAGHPLLEPSDVEIRRRGASYTVDTLRELSRTRPGVELFLIVGIDAWLEVDTWHRPAELLALANVVVTTRPGAPFPNTGPLPPVAARGACCYDPTIGSYVHSSGHRLVVQAIDGIEASSTEIRRRISQNLPIDHLVAPPVALYIHRHGLYA
jgi:nicotinate-nucleotide adenylyltransferase